MLVVAGVIVILVMPHHQISPGKRPAELSAVPPKPMEWQPPDSNELAHSPMAELIRYGKKLIASTARYMGPRGIVGSYSNGMNCQNCHLDAGARLYGNNYSAVFSTYPKFRERSGTVEDIYKRVNDCMQRSLNGKSLDTGSREMQAIKAYICWLGGQVPRNTKPPGSGITDLAFPDRAADPVRGGPLYVQKCQLCHGVQGEGLPAADSMEYVYPPLWGPHSYTTGAGLFRISRLAGYIKDNMPFGSSHAHSQLTDEEAWDLAAYVNSQPRPDRRFSRDWPDISHKPIDHPFGPYADGFTEKQHKFGPFSPILQVRQQQPHAGQQASAKGK